MYLRLAFGVAAHLEPEILIVDEVLAVGDAAFQRKCLGKMGEVSGEGRTVLLVSHNMAAITTLADKCLWLDQGQVRELGGASEVIADYLSSDMVSARPGFADLSEPRLRESVPKRTTKDITFEWVRLYEDEEKTTDVFFEGEPMTIEMGLLSKIHTTRLEVLCLVRTLEGVLVFTLTSGLVETDLRPGGFEISVSVPRNQLRPGRYQIDLYTLTGAPQDYLPGAISFEVAGTRTPSDDPRHARDDIGLVTVEQQWGRVRQGSRSRSSADS